jgi:hypothetical protein
VGSPAWQIGEKVPNPSIRSRRGVVAAALVAVALTSALTTTADAAPARDGGGSTCKRRCADTVAPTVVVSAPTTGSTVSGSVTVTGSAGDNVAVTAVAVQVDGGAWSPAGGTTSWSAVLDTTTYADGDHVFVARATDAAGNTSTTSVTALVANAAAADTTPPTVVISSPASGSTVSGVVTVSGTASDASGVASVTVSVDGGEWQAASGTGAWSKQFDTVVWAAGTHTITARATDASGNAATASVSLTTGSSSEDVVVRDPKATYGLELLGRTRLPTWGSVTGVLASESFTNGKVVWFRDAGTGVTSAVELPSDSNQGWYELASVMSSPSDLWLMGGSGPLVVRHYVLSGTPLATSAALVESRTFGDSDSRQGDLVVLASGAVVAAWHQQGANGLPHGQFVAYRGAGGWQQLPALTHMATRSSDQVLGQHPVDGSVWLFANPDAWGAIGVTHFTEAAGTLRVDWVDPYFLRDEEYGLNGPHGENPYLAVAADPTTNTLALAYQSADFKRFTNGTTEVAGARVAVARFPAAGGPTFSVAPVWAERVAGLGLIIAGGETLVIYRAVDESTLSTSNVSVSRFRNGAWEPAERVGDLSTSAWPVGYGTTRNEIAAGLADRNIHFRTI